MKNQRILSITITTFAILIFTTANFAQESQETDEAALAKATQNPLAAMYSLPFQNNTTYEHKCPGIL